jgi:hypothetical protein
VGNSHRSRLKLAAPNLFSAHDPLASSFFIKPPFKNGGDDYHDRHCDFFHGNLREWQSPANAGLMGGREKE